MPPSNQDACEANQSSLGYIFSPASIAVAAIFFLALEWLNDDFVSSLAPRRLGQKILWP